MSGGQAIVEAEVRELVRLRGIDPAADPSAVSALVDEVVADYLRSGRHVSPAAARRRRRAVSRAVYDAIAGFGPLQPLLDDPDRRGDLDQRAGPGVRRPGAGAPS